MRVSWRASHAHKRASKGMSTNLETLPERANQTESGQEAPSSASRSPRAMKILARRQLLGTRSTNLVTAQGVSCAARLAPKNAKTLTSMSLET